MENSDTGNKKNVDNIFRFSFPKQSFYIEFTDKQQFKRPFVKVLKLKLMSVTDYRVNVTEQNSFLELFFFNYSSIIRNHIVVPWHL